MHQYRTVTAASGRWPRLTAFAGVVSLIVAAAAGCSSTGSKAGSGPIDITYWTSSTQSEINYLDAHFNSTHKGIKVTGQYIASADNTTAKEVATLKTNTEPNVVI